VRGALLFVHACLPVMQKAGRGRIVNMASLAATMIGPGTSAYCVAKATLVRLTEHIDAEQRDNGVRAFTGHPGTIVTEMMHDTLRDPGAIRYAPHIIAYLTPFLSVDTSREAARLGAQMVEIAAGQRDAEAGRYIDFEQEMRPAAFGPPPPLAASPEL
jgi:NAD(P)-dependent dehydrogenase (short-subunit alcohol dehydrogenase family)